MLFFWPPCQSLISKVAKFCRFCSRTTFFFFFFLSSVSSLYLLLLVVLLRDGVTQDVQETDVSRRGGRVPKHLQPKPANLKRLTHTCTYMSVTLSQQSELLCRKSEVMHHITIPPRGPAIQSRRRRTEGNWARRFMKRGVGGAVCSLNMLFPRRESGVTRGRVHFTSHLV